MELDRKVRLLGQPGNNQHVDVVGNEKEGVGEGEDDGNAQDGGEPDVRKDYWVASWLIIHFTAVNCISNILRKIPATKAIDKWSSEEASHHHTPGSNSH